jgi:3-oxoacyl-[acyl-carrier-protein] synthase II
MRQGINLLFRWAAMPHDRVVITGAGVVCALGDSPLSTWDALIAGGRGIRPIEGFDARGFDCAVAAQVLRGHPDDLGIDPRETRIMNTHSSILIKAVRDAFTASGLDAASIPRDSIAFFAGMGMVDYRVEDLLPAVLKSLDARGELDYSAFYTEGYREIHPLWSLSMLNNISFCQVAIDLDIQGENTVLSPHANSGAQAVSEAMKCVEDRKCTVALAAGVSETITPLSLARGHLAGILNTKAGSAEDCVKPFDKDRRGTVLGEGCGVVVLELSSTAEKRGIVPLAVMSGYGTAFEPEAGLPGPSVRALTSSIRSALARAQIGPSDIDLIISHGEGSPGGDRNEIEAIQQVFSESPDRVKVFSSKAALGHLLAAAPVVDLVLGISILRNGTIPMTLNTRNPDPSVPFTLVIGEPLRADVGRILINCQSSEGHAASLIVEGVGR